MSSTLISLNSNVSLGSISQDLSPNTFETESTEKIDRVSRDSITPQEQAKPSLLSKRSIATNPSNQATKKTASCFERFLSFLKKTCRQIAACLKLLITTNRNYNYSTSSIDNRTLSQGLLGGRGMGSDSSPPTLTPASSTKDGVQRKKEARKSEPSRKRRKATKKEIARDPSFYKLEIQNTLDRFSKEIEIGVKTPKILGLKNITGVNCYMNASLQLLDSALRTDDAFLQLIKKPLKREENQSLIDFEEKVLSGWAKLKREDKETNEHFERRILFKWSFLVLMQAKNYSKDGDVIATLRNFHKACFYLGLSSNFPPEDVTEQQDADEFLTYLHSTLNISYLATSTKLYGTNNDGGREIKKNKPMPMSVLYFPAREDRSSRIEQEKIETKKKQLEVLKTSYKTQQQKTDARKLFENFVKQEKLNPEDKINDKEVKDGFRKTRLSTVEVEEGVLKDVLPNGFFIVLKRFDVIFDSKGKGIPVKIEDEIDFSKARKINLKKYLSNQTKQVLRELKNQEFEYEITSFAVHMGDLGGGHYISYVKRDGVWYECDDHAIRKIKEENLPIGKAYIWYYQKSNI